jgi:hypothetical protein
MQAIVNQDEKAGRGNTSRYPFPPSSTKPTTPHEIGEELPIEMVISLLQVQLAQNA